MSAYETYTFEQELKKLDGNQTILKAAELDLRTQILHSDFLTDYRAFENKLSVFQNAVTTLVETLQNPVAVLPQVTPLVGEERVEGAKPEPSFGYAKAGFLAVCVICTMIGAVVYGVIPPMMLVYVIFVLGGWAFTPQLIGFIRGLLTKEKEEEKPETLQDWVTNELQKMRQKYTSVRFLVKIQTQNKEKLPNYALLGIDEALYDRRKQFEELLPSEFLGVTGKIVVACDRNCWLRKALVIGAITAAKQASMGKTS